MPDLWTILSAPFVELLGWVLLHFVWQGALLAVGLAGGLYLLRGHAPQVRYAVSCAALVGLLVLPMGTGLFLAERLPGAASPTASPGEAETPPIAVEARGRVPLAGEESVSPSSWRAWAAAWLRPALPWIVLGWAAGVLLFSVRLASGAWRVRRLRRTSTPASERWRDRLGALADRMGLRGEVALHVSDRVDGPVVAGWWRPVVLVPAGFLTGLPPEQVEALLLHELAHVRRHDVLVGRLQAVLETLLFFHPATWWISRQVRNARETCCDDLAVQAGPDRTVYARALAALAERVVAAPRPAGALATSDGALLARIRRLLDPTGRPSRNARRLSMAVALLLLVAFPLGIAACASQQSATATEATEAAPDTSRREDRARGVTVDPTRDVNQVRVIRKDSLNEVTLMLIYEGGRVDTFHVSPESYFGSDGAKWREHFGLNSGDVGVPEPPSPDSLEREFHFPFDSDSLGPGFSLQFDPDSLAAQVYRLHADSLSSLFDERVSEDSLALGFRQHFADSTLVFSPDVFDREEFDLGGVDSLLHRGEVGALDSLIMRRREETGDLDSLLLRRPERGDIDSLFHWRVYRADSLHAHLDSLQDEIRPLLDSLRRRIHPRLDSLRRHLEQMRERWAETMPERLRELARRLREQAERLEERAEEMGEQRSEKRRQGEPADGGQNVGPFGEASRRLLRGGANGIIHIRNKSSFEWTAPLLIRSGRI